MMRNMDEYKKCSSIDSNSELNALMNLTNPYNYNFRVDKRHMHSCDFKRLHNKVNFDYINRK